MGREKIAEKGVKNGEINNTKNERYYCSSPLIGASMHTMPVPARFLPLSRVRFEVEDRALVMETLERGAGWVSIPRRRIGTWLVPAPGGRRGLDR